MVTIKPTRVTGCSIPTPHLPSLSIIRGSKFIKAPSNTSPTAEKAARIFQSKAIDNKTPLSLGMIPLSPQGQAFTETHYWWIPVSAAAIFAALIERLAYDSSEWEDITLASNIFDNLSLQSCNAYLPDDDARGSGPSDGSGPSGGGGSKRKDTGGKSSSSSDGARRRLKKCRVAATVLGIVVNPVTTQTIP
jgi:hypothetical protein